MSIVKEKGTISVHTDNLFPIIKKWLYSEHDIFLRELISNAHDAIIKLQRLSDLGKYGGNISSPLIRIDVDKKARTIKVSDGGIGMTAEEVKKYINQIAFSGAKEFLEKYQQGKEEKQIIGHFGMGFFSSFMVADQVEIDTLSFQEKAEAVHWSCDGNVNFEMGPSERKDIGTEITLHIHRDSEEFLDDQKMRDLVKRYSNYLPAEIQVNGSKANAQDAVWNQSPGKNKEEDYKKFYQELFPLDGDPLFYVHFSVDYPFNLRGVIYFPRNKNDFDLTRKGRIQLYCNNVFVSDNIIDIIPKYLNLLQGVIDSPDIPLNVSRSFLQGNPKVKKIGEHIVNKVGDKLRELFDKKREDYEKYWMDIHPFVKFGSMNDEKFYDKVKDVILFKNVDEKHLTIEEYKKQNEKLKDKVVYATKKSKQIAYVEKVKKQGIDVLYLDSPIDTHFIQHLEMKLAPLRFLRVDASVGEKLFEKEGEKKEEQEKFKEVVDAFRKSVGEDKLEIEFQAFEDKEIPGMITVSEQLRRMNDMSAMMAGRLPDENNSTFHSLVLNESNPMIRKVIAMAQGQKSNQEQFKNICRHVHDLALLQHGSLKGEKLTDFVHRATCMMNEAWLIDA